MPTEMEDYLFDLQGYLILKQAVDTDHLSEMNSVIDRWATKEDAQWREKATQNDPPFSISFDKVAERDTSFLKLVNHPAWAEHMKRYIGSQDPPSKENTEASYPRDAIRTGDFPILERATANIRGPGILPLAYTLEHTSAVHILNSDFITTDFVVVRLTSFLH